MPMAYSLNPTHYFPMCRACHVVFDLVVAATGRGARLQAPALQHHSRRAS
jgi:hypothetical protein